MTETGDCETLEPPLVQCISLGGAIAQLRERGAHRCDPVRFRFIEALAKRASAHEGDARRVLDGKLAKLLLEYEEQFDKARFDAGNILRGVAGRFPEAAHDLRQLYIAGDFRGLRRLTASLEAQCQRGPLVDLVRHIAAHSSEDGGGNAAQAAVADIGSSAELKTLKYFRSTWSMLSTDQRLNQSLAKVPENAGPLNSHVLALRSLKLMRDISPEYLNRFMSYLDALLWLDQANDRGALVQKDVARNDGDRKQKAGRKRTG